MTTAQTHLLMRRRSSLPQGSPAQPLCRTTAALFAAAIALVVAMALSVCAPTEAHAAASLSKAKLTLHHGVSKTLTLNGVSSRKEVSWSSSNKSVVAVAEVNSTQVTLTGLKRGTAKVKAKVGTKTYTCIVTVPKYKKVKTVAATCIDRGKQVFYCYDCKKNYNIYSSPLGHKWALINTYDATYFSAPCNEYQCARCKKTYTEDTGEAIPPLSPTSAEYVLDDAESGYATGTVTVTVPDDIVAFNTHLILRWANEDGLMEEYGDFTTAHGNRSEASISIPAYVLIPEGATELRAYARINGTLSKDYAIAKIPEHQTLAMEGSVTAAFQIMSDLHVNTNTADTIKQRGIKNLRVALDDIATLNPNSMSVVVGDMVDRGREEEFVWLDQMIGDHEGIDRRDVYYAIGNHEIMLDKVIPSAKEGRLNQQTQFKTYAAEAEGVEFAGTSPNQVYYAFKRDGIHHIVLGNEDPSLRNDAYLTPTQISWLEKQLQAAEEDTGNGPIFVYLHQSLYNTIAGGLGKTVNGVKLYQKWDGVVSYYSVSNSAWASHTDGSVNSSSAMLRAVLKKYPQVMLFDGHSHWELSSIGNLHPRNDGSDGGDGLPTILNTASVAYLNCSCDDPENMSHKNAAGSQGYYVRVYESGTLIMGRDFLNGQYVPTACYFIPNA